MSYSDLTKGRFSLTNQIYLITTVCENRKPFFLDLQLARIVIRELQNLQNSSRVNSLAYVLMPDHLHWLIELCDGSLADLVNHLKGRSARQINQHLQVTGSVWQRGFHDHGIRTDENIKSIARYVIANPLRAGLVSRVNDYPHWDAIWLDQTLDS